MGDEGLARRDEQAHVTRQPGEECAATRYIRPVVVASKAMAAAVRVRGGVAHLAVVTIEDVIWTEEPMVVERGNGRGGFFSAGDERGERCARHVVDMDDVRLKGANLVAHCVNDAAIYDFLPGPAGGELDAVYGDTVYVLVYVVCDGAATVDFGQSVLLEDKQVGTLLNWEHPEPGIIEGLLVLQDGIDQPVHLSGSPDEVFVARPSHPDTAPG